MYDLVIVGAGPAGSNLARLIKDKKVLILERRDFSKVDGKSCGGLLNEDTKLFLSRLGISIPKEVVKAPQTQILKAYDMDNSLLASYRKDYLNIDRFEFDKYMLGLVGDNVEVKRASFQDARYSSRGLVVSYLEDGEEKEVECKILVGADGGASKVRKEVFPEKKFSRRYLAVQYDFEKIEDVPYMGAVFSKELTDYYSWFIPKDESIIIGGAFPEGSNVKSKMELLTLMLRARGLVFGEKVSSSGAILIRPSVRSDLFGGESSIALVGESAGLISPSSSEGISFALKSSTALAKAISNNENFFFEAYGKFLNKEWRRIFLKGLKGNLIYSKGLRGAFMKTGLLKIEGI
ncbi:MAG: oxidoreductase [Tissierellia bacterium]|nr:oxidoreductase [Tissierellia bacterium]